MIGQRLYPSSWASKASTPLPMGWGVNSKLRQVLKSAFIFHQILPELSCAWAQLPVRQRCGECLSSPSVTILFPGFPAKFLSTLRVCCPPQTVWSFKQTGLWAFPFVSFHIYHFYWKLRWTRDFSPPLQTKSTSNDTVGFQSQPHSGSSASPKLGGRRAALSKTTTDSHCSDQDFKNFFTNKHFSMCYFVSDQCSEPWNGSEQFCPV